MADDQQGITSSIFSAIRDQLVEPNNWGNIAGSLIILQQLVLQWLESHKNGTYVRFDAGTITLITLIFVVLGVRARRKEQTQTNTTLPTQ